VRGAVSADLRRIAVEVIERLLAADASVAVAESCTGGLIAAALTTVPGASRVLWGSAVVYSEAAKITLTAIEPEILEEHGTVSAATSVALAAAVRLRADSTYGIAVTGWAGPTADEGGAVGEVHGALSSARGTSSGSWYFDGDRDEVREQAAYAVLSLLRGHLAAAQDGADE
jgi:PncC family amidohydrolase